MIQVSPARGAGLAWQRTYNSNDDRPGPFGTGWTHAYDIRTDESATTDKDNTGTTVGINKIERTDFFGGKHHYTRDADGLYSPPPYMFDELSSEYNQFLVDGPPDVLSDDQKGMDGTVKHFFKNGDERACDSIEDRHGNRTTLAYDLVVTIGSVSKGLLTRVTDPSGRYLEVGWTNLGTEQNPAWRITQVAGPFNDLGQPVYVVTYEYNGDFNLWKVHQDPGGLNRVTTLGYTSFSGMQGTETGLLASISDPLNHTVSCNCGLQDWNASPFPTWTLRVADVSEPGTGGAARRDPASGRAPCILNYTPPLTVRPTPAGRTGAPAAWA